MQFMSTQIEELVQACATATERRRLAQDEVALAEAAERHARHRLMECVFASWKELDCLPGLPHQLVDLLPKEEAELAMHRVLSGWGLTDDSPIRDDSLRAPSKVNRAGELAGASDLVLQLRNWFLEAT